jgi:hypothetical protein
MLSANSFDAISWIIHIIHEASRNRLAHSLIRLYEAVTVTNLLRTSGLGPARQDLASSSLPRGAPTRGCER